jgi:ABC-type transport system involved in cytochrome c biogenesis permease subunit
MARSASATVAAPKRVREEAGVPSQVQRKILSILAGFLVLAGMAGYLLELPETPLVALAMAGYVVASVCYGVALVRAATRWSTAASLSATAGLLLQTAAIAGRWAVAGHPPFSNMYEMLLSFAWGVALLHVVFERKYGASYSGVLAMPVTTLSLVLMMFMDASVRPLVPALQSSLLHIHVSLAVISYAAFALSFATALLYLAKDGVSLEAFGAWASGLAAFIYAAILGAFFRGGSMVLPAWDAVNRQKILVERGVPLHVAVSGLGWLVLAGFIATLLPAACYLWFGREGFARKMGALLWISLAGQVLASGFFIVSLAGGSYPGIEIQQSFSTSPMAVPFVIPGLLLGITATGLILLFSGRYETILSRLPSAERLDRLTYRIIQVGLPLLTLMIVTGAFWANRAWGSYWSWDPKEDWALITWFTYAAYLHTRMLKGWRGRRSAYFAIAGFAVVLFTFFGVSFLLAGLHSYAS